jgi:hypothetical protein
MNGRLSLFQYAIIFHPTEKEAKNGKKSKIVVEPTTIMAETETIASMKIIKKIPKEYDERLDQIEIAIRPF